MNTIKLSRAAVAAIAALCAATQASAAVRLISPAEGETVPLLSAGQKAWLDAPRAERRAKFADEEERKLMRKLGYHPLEVPLSWEWTAPDASGPEASARPLFTVEVRRASDGVPVFRADCPEPNASVGNLEIGREYEWTVWASALGRVEAPVSGRFVTEDHAPRLLHLPGVPNVRDLGGRIGLGGRRVRQGLVYRSAGLNDNAGPNRLSREDSLAASPDPAAILALEKKLNKEVSLLKGLRTYPGSFRPLAPVEFTPEWTAYRTDVGRGEFAERGLPPMLALDEVPESFLGTAAERVQFAADGGFAFPTEVHKAAKGMAVFVKVVEYPDDGWATLGCGADWWWTLAVNGDVVFDRSLDRGNNRNPISPENHAFAVPVKKGKNVFAAAVACGRDGWRWCCVPSPAAPVAETLGAKIRNDELRIDEATHATKGLKPGKTRIDDKNRKIALEQLGIRSDIDLRNDNECYGMEGSPLGPTVTWWHYSSGYYGGMKTDEARAAFANVFRVFLNPANYPIDFHCIAGQDRTGAVAFILNALLGVEEEELWRDWEATGFWNPSPRFNHARLFDKLVAVFDEYPGDTINARVEAYVLSLGFSKDDIEQFRFTMLEQQ